MRIVTLAASPRPKPGVLLGTQVVDLAACAAVLPEAGCIPHSVRGILEAGETALDLIRRLSDRVAEANESLLQQLQARGALRAREDVRLLAPLPDTRLILAVGMNYRQHLREMGGAVPERPIAFSKCVNAIIGPDAPIVIPKHYPTMVDWEAEFCAVIGRPCHHVSPEEALDYVAGYTLVNDVSARDWIARFGELHGMAAIEGWERNLLGKQFPTFCPMGPTLVSKDELRDPNSVRFELKVNDQVMQSACTDDLVFSVATLIAYYSDHYMFLPGDVITTGSPGGVGIGRKPPIFLRPGDVVKMGGDAIGTMSNPVVGAQ